MQIIACAGDVYAIDKTLSKRTWGLIWGAVLMLFAFVPSRLPAQLYAPGFMHPRASVAACFIPLESEVLKSKHSYLIIGAFADFRHFRVLNVIALIGTSYTALYILVSLALESTIGNDNGQASFITALSRRLMLDEAWLPDKA